MNILCKLFGHDKVTLWCQVEGWRCWRCGKEVIYRKKPINEWARAIPSKYVGPIRLGEHVKNTH